VGGRYGSLGDSCCTNDRGRIILADLLAKPSASLGDGWNWYTETGERVIWLKDATAGDYTPNDGGLNGGLEGRFVIENGGAAGIPQDSTIFAIPTNAGTTEAPPWADVENPTIAEIQAWYDNNVGPGLANDEAQEPGDILTYVSPGARSLGWDTGDGADGTVRIVPRGGMTAPQTIEQPTIFNIPTNAGTTEVPPWVDVENPTIAEIQAWYDSNVGPGLAFDEAQEAGDILLYASPGGLDLGWDTGDGADGTVRVTTRGSDTPQVQGVQTFSETLLIRTDPQTADTDAGRMAAQNAAFGAYTAGDTIKTPPGNYFGVPTPPANNLKWDVGNARIYNTADNTPLYVHNPVNGNVEINGGIFNNNAILDTNANRAYGMQLGGNNSVFDLDVDEINVIAENAIALRMAGQGNTYNGEVSAVTSSGYDGVQIENLTGPSNRYAVRVKHIDTGTTGANIAQSNIVEITGPAIEGSLHVDDGVTGGRVFQIANSGELTHTFNTYKARTGGDFGVIAGNSRVFGKRLYMETPVDGVGLTLSNGNNYLSVDEFVGDLTVGGIGAGIRGTGSTIVSERLIGQITVTADYNTIDVGRIESGGRDSITAGNTNFREGEVFAAGGAVRLQFPSDGSDEFPHLYTRIAPGTAGAWNAAEEANWTDNGRAPLFFVRLSANTSWSDEPSYNVYFTGENRLHTVGPTFPNTWTPKAMIPDRGHKHKIIEGSEPNDEYTIDQDTYTEILANVGTIEWLGSITGVVQQDFSSFPEYDNEWEAQGDSLADNLGYRTRDGEIRFKIERPVTDYRRVPIVYGASQKLSLILNEAMNFGLMAQMWGDSQEAYPAPFHAYLSYYLGLAFGLPSRSPIHPPLSTVTADEGRFGIDGQLVGGTSTGIFDDFNPPQHFRRQHTALAGVAENAFQFGHKPFNDHLELDAGGTPTQLGSKKELAFRDPRDIGCRIYSYGDASSSPGLHWRHETESDPNLSINQTDVAEAHVNLNLDQAANAGKVIVHDTGLLAYNPGEPYNNVIVAGSDGVNAMQTGLINFGARFYSTTGRDSGITIDNFSNGGYTTDDFLGNHANCGSVVPYFADYQLAIFTAGVNDALQSRTQAQTKSDVLAHIDWVRGNTFMDNPQLDTDGITRRPNIHFLIIGEFPNIPDSILGTSNMSDAEHAILLDQNITMMEIAERATDGGRDNVTFINTYEKCRRSGWTGDADSIPLTPDGIHTGQWGAQLRAKLVVDVLVDIAMNGGYVG